MNKHQQALNWLVQIYIKPYGIEDERIKLVEELATLQDRYEILLTALRDIDEFVEGIDRADRRKLGAATWTLQGIIAEALQNAHEELKKEEQNEEIIDVGCVGDD